MSMRTLFFLLAWPTVAAAQSRASSPYRVFWSDSGAVHFVRALSDSTVMVMDVRYAPQGWLTDLSASFTQFSLRCDVGSPANGYIVTYSELAHGNNEVEAMRIAYRSRADTSRVNFNSRWSMMVLDGCQELKRREAR